ncbi:S9 family peptidase [Porticoccus sp.]|uniref:S9 family peptidase n=1 Tax=Porticoccus sp. TaxID=2024853 RepID=UPI003F69E0C9
MPLTAPYGSWSSPVVPDLLTRSVPGFAWPRVDGDNLYWLESRPWENGRSVVIQKDLQGNIRDVLNAPLSVRSRVHEYGGTPYLVADNMLYFCLQDDQRLYAQNLANSHALPVPLTPEGDYRFADFCLDQKRQRLICVAEDHRQPGEPENLLVSVPLDQSMVIQRLCEGADFYAYPRLDNSGDRLCWISWNHPDLPWDNTCLWLAELGADGNPLEPRLLAGNGHESIVQPCWSPDNQLYFVSDRDNWWNLYRWDSDSDCLSAILSMEAEFATPLWVLGMSNYDFCDDGTLVCSYTLQGRWQLAILPPGNQCLQEIPNDYTQISDLYCRGNRAWLVGASTTRGVELAELDTQGQHTQHNPLSVLARGNSLAIQPGYLSSPQPVSFSSTGGDIAHGFFYPPANPEYSGPANSLPPLIVVCHGGPTGATSSALNLKIQYWTSRGFAVLDVNYRGSTGYGRQYRQKLQGEWGIVDVEDVTAGARHLIEQKKVDPRKIAIRGSSAGGYTALAALCFGDLFKAGACLYGIGDLETLARDTHKFESRYLDRLVGPYPEKKSRYRERSPLYHAENFHCPVIFFQGLDDEVVPPEQALTMVKALKEKHLPVAYLPFADEGHGFRKAETIRQALEAELYFYGKVFGFTPADKLPEISTHNLQE